MLLEIIVVIPLAIILTIIFNHGDRKREQKRTGGIK